MTKKTAAIKKVSVRELEKTVFGDPKELPKLKKATIKAKHALKKTELKIKTVQKSIKQKEAILKKATMAANKKKSPAATKAKKTAKLAVDKMKKELKLVEKLFVETTKNWKFAVAQEALFEKREISRQWAVMSFVKKWEKEFAAKSKAKKKVSTRSTSVKPASRKQAASKTKPVDTVIPMMSQTTPVHDSAEHQHFSRPVSSWGDNLKRK